MRAVITGANGLLGCDLVQVFGGEACVVALRGRKQLDLTVASAVTETIDAARPDVIIHSAGLRDVDWCETHPEEAYKANVLSTRNLCLGARKWNALIVYVSSDSVFDGTAAPYHEFSETHPVNVYGRTKLAAEHVIVGLTHNYIIARMPVLFGIGGREDDNRVVQTLAKLRAKTVVRASCDQVCGPTYTPDAARAVRALVEEGTPGIYHVSGPGEASVYEFLLETSRQAHEDEDLLVPVRSSELNRPAKRPLHTTLTSVCLPQSAGIQVRPWRVGLAELVEAVKIGG